MDDLHIADLPPSELLELDEALYVFNSSTTGIHDGRSLAASVRDADGRLIAAAAGHTWGGTCELRQVWVAEAHRQRGLGRRLMAAAEEEAVRRGCTQIVLTTHSFQAPGFYRLLGFTILFELADYPAGHSQFVLRKLLPGHEPTSRSDHR